MTTKECKRCNILTNRFYKNSRSKDGLQSYCKECSNILAIEYHKNQTTQNREDRVFDYIKYDNKIELTQTQIEKKTIYCNKRISILKKLQEEHNNVIDSSFDELHRIRAKIDKYNLAITVLNNQDIVKQLINSD